MQLVGDILTYLTWVVGRTVAVDQGVSACVTAWLSHGHVTPHGNQLVSVTLAR